MERGWIKSWAKTEDSAVFQDPVLFKVWMWCLWRARRQPKTVTMRTGRGETTVELELARGEFVFGRNEAAKALRLPPSTVRNKMSRLGTMGNLTIKPDSHWSVVTICNYEEYQGERTGNWTGNWTGKGQAKDTREKLRGLREVKPSCPAAPHDDGFETFWKAYPKKVGKGAARKAWGKAKKSLNGGRDLLTVCLPTLERLKASRGWIKDNGQFIPNPATWLNREGWEDMTDEQHGPQQPRLAL